MPSHRLQAFNCWQCHHQPKPSIAGLVIKFTQQSSIRQPEAKHTLCLYTSNWDQGRYSFIHEHLDDFDKYKDFHRHHDSQRTSHRARKGWHRPDLCWHPWGQSHPATDINTSASPLGISSQSSQSSSRSSSQSSMPRLRTISGLALSLSSLAASAASNQVILIFLNILMLIPIILIFLNILILFLIINTPFDPSLLCTHLKC